MKSGVTLIALIAIVGLAGCENEQQKLNDQHHLFALQGCIAQTGKADEALKEMYSADPSLTNTLNQSGHNYRAAECMSVEEKTTIAFQREKHDDYGKCEQCAPEAATR